MELEVLSTKAAADILGVAPKTLNKWVLQGKIDCYQINTKSRRFSPHHIREFLARNEKTFAPQSEPTVSSPCIKRREPTHEENAREIRQWL